MKNFIHMLTALGLAALIYSAAAQDNNGEPAGPPPPPPDNGTVVVVPAAPAGEAAQPSDQAPPAADQAAPGADNGASLPSGNGQRTSTTIQPTEPLGVEHATVASEFVPPETGGTNSNPDDLTLNYKDAPMDMVLNYLSDAAGFIIVLDTHVGGTVSVNGKHLTKDEAVDLLNSVLNKNGYAAIRDGRTLTIVSKEDAKTRDIPVKSGNDPAGIPNNDEIVTQIIPIRFVDARQLVSDLSSFVSPQATVVANDAGNSIVITDTQSNIRHIAEIIKAVDDSAEAETEIQVFKLTNANPNDVAAELSTVFPSSTSGNGAQSPIRFGGGFGGGPGGGFFQRMMGGGGGGGAAAGGDSNSDRIKKATQVSAVADARISAVIVTAPKDLMAEIAEMMKELDVPSPRDQDVYVFKMNNGDPQQALTVLQGMFQSSSTSRSGSSSSSSTSSALQQRIINNNQSSSSSSSSSGFGSGSGGVGGGSGGRSF